MKFDVDSTSRATDTEVQRLIESICLHASRSFIRNTTPHIRDGLDQWLMHNRAETVSKTSPTAPTLDEVIEFVLQDRVVGNLCEERHPIAIIADGHGNIDDLEFRPDLMVVFAVDSDEIELDCVGRLPFVSASAISRNLSSAVDYTSYSYEFPLIHFLGDEDREMMKRMAPEFRALRDL